MQMPTKLTSLAFTAASDVRKTCPVPRDLELEPAPRTQVTESLKKSRAPVQASISSTSIQNAQIFLYVCIQDQLITTLLGLD